MEEIYQQMWATAFPLIQAGKVNLDKEINNPFDTRRGLTLLLRPNKTILNNLQTFLKEAQKLEPDQYYYPNTDIHTTVLSIISCRKHFSLKNIDIHQYKKLIIKSLLNIPSFSLNYTGITLSSSGVLTKGYEKENELENIRANLRNNFKSSAIENTIDQRYILSTAHSTLIRFRQPLRNPKLFSEFLKSHQTTIFGSCLINNLELVYNDWYQQIRKVEVLMKLELREQVINKLPKF